MTADRLVRITSLALALVGSVCIARVAEAQPVAHEEATLAPASGLATHGGAAVAIDGNYAAVGVPGTGTATTHGTVYVYHQQSPGVWIVEQTISDPEETAPPLPSPTQDMFGASIAIEGTTIVVGDPGHATGAGQAWILTRGGGSPPWSSTRIAPPSPAGTAPMRFGTSVAISGSRIVVGAPDSGGGRAGAVFLYDTAGALQSPSITTPAGVVGSSLFGFSVAIAGTSVLVGAPGASQVYPFELGATWTAGATWTGPSMGKFGAAVALAPAGLIAVIGAHEENSHGAAYVMERAVSTAAWPDISSAVPLVASDTAASDHFGVSVAASDDAVVVGAPNHDAAGVDAGSAYLFVPDATGAHWRAVSRFDVTTASAGDQLGTSVAVRGMKMIAGAPRPATMNGYAAVFGLPLADGAPCEATAAARCGSGFCVDGVCCATECGGGDADCTACSVAMGGTTNGTCTPARATMSCTACGMVGTCNAGVCVGGVGCDSGISTDTGTASMDGGGDGGTRTPPHHVSGCKCEVGSGGADEGRWALALAFLALLSQRRRLWVGRK